MKKLIALTIVYVGLTLNLPSCSSTESYVLDETVEKARLRVAIVKGNISSGMSGDVGIIRHFSDHQCAGESEFAVILTQFSIATPPKLSMPLADFMSDAFAERYVEAEKTQHFMYEFQVTIPGVYSETDLKCGVLIDAKFAAGRDYEFVGSFVNEGVCEVSLNQIVETDGGAVRELIATYNNAVPEGREGCLEIF